MRRHGWCERGRPTRLGDAAARDAYREYIARASQSDAQGIATAVARADALER
jgi:hypothetical protein